MADMAAELAFINAQKEYDPTMDYTSAAAAEQPVADDDEDEEEYDPSTAYPAYDAQPNGSPSEQSASMPESTANTPPVGADGGLKPQPAAAAAPSPSKQPRTMGGFVVESEDEDEMPVSKPQAAGSALLNANGVSQSPQRSLTNTPSNILAQNNVPLNSAQDLGQTGVLPSPSVATNAAAPIQSPAVPSAGPTPVPDTTKTGPPDLLSAASGRQSTAPVTPVPASLPKQRLPQDRVGILEDRITEDPRGDIEAWQSLIDDHRRRHKMDDARATFERFFKFFPTAAEMWIEWLNMETDLDELKNAERIFERSIMANPHVGLWVTYINYTRRIHNVHTNDQARGTITQVYEFVLDQIGIDISSGPVWQSYLEFIKTDVGIIGGSTWQDRAKVDLLRKIYQRAIAVPTNALLEIWREYDKFELGLNKITGRKHLQERSPFYMTARSANNVLDNITRGINRTTLPKLPPIEGFDGYSEYMQQVQLWKKWLLWEKDDPLLIKDDNRSLYNKRVLYLYKQALMALRFWPELWYDAADWCFENDLEQEGNTFLTQGIDANPESCLLAFRRAHQIELKGDFEEGEAGALKKGEAVREPFDKVLGELYSFVEKTKKRKEFTIARANETFTAQQAAEEAARATAARDSDDDEDNEAEAANRRKEKEENFKKQVQGISAGFNEQMLALKKTITYAWIALMRTMRRIQGKGRPDHSKGVPPGFRGIFKDARSKGHVTSDLYVASAGIEHHCYQDPAATKIFERGMKLFPEDEDFALQYIKHLVKMNDATNARAVFETVVTRLTSKPENIHRAKALFVYFHEYEARFGELAQIVKLEKRMHDLFPEDPQLSLFSQRYSAPTFDPTKCRPIISPKSQMKPALPTAIMPSIEAPHPGLPQVHETRPSPVINSPRVAPALAPIVNSPKRPFDEVDNEPAQPRKLPRGESPLKGAAGRRLDAARRNMARASEGVASTPIAAPASLPREITFLLSIIPNARYYQETRFSAEKLVGLLRRTDMAQARLPGAAPPQTPVPTMSQPPQMSPWGAQPPMGYYGR